MSPGLSRRDGLAEDAVAHGASQGVCADHVHVDLQEACHLRLTHPSRPAACLGLHARHRTAGCIDMDMDRVGTVP